MRGHDLSNRVARLERRVAYLLQFAPKSLTANSGVFSLTGMAATLRAGTFLTAGTGAFALTGQTAALRRGLRATAGAGSYALTGQSVTLKKGISLTAAAGSFAMTGSAATLRRSRLLTAAAGSFALTGQSATLTKGAALSFPDIANVATTSASPGGTSHTVNLPTGIVSGSLVLIFGTLSGSAGRTQSISGFAELVDTGSPYNDPNFGIHYRFCDGSEGATVSADFSSSVTSSHWYAVRITGHHASEPPAISSRSTASTANPNPPSLTPGWGSAKNLWLAIAAAKGATATAYPTDFSDDQNTGSQSVASVAFASRSFEGSVLDPGTFTISSSQNSHAFTLAIRPA